MEYARLKLTSAWSQLPIARRRLEELLETPARVKGKSSGHLECIDVFCTTGELRLQSRRLCLIDMYVTSNLEPTILQSLRKLIVKQILLLLANN